MLEKFKLKGEALTGWGEMALYVMVCIGQSWNSSLLPCILTEVHFFFFFKWKKWQLTPVFLSGEAYGQRSQVGYSPWGRKELDTAETS